MASHYQTLGVERTVGIQEVRAAYDQLKMRLISMAPDTLSNRALMKEARKAYLVLSNPKSRFEYDASLGTMDPYQSPVVGYEAQGIVEMIRLIFNHVKNYFGFNEFARHANAVERISLAPDVVAGLSYKPRGRIEAGVENEIARLRELAKSRGIAFDDFRTHALAFSELREQALNHGIGLQNLEILVQF